MIVRSVLKVNKQLYALVPGLVILTVRVLFFCRLRLPNQEPNAGKQQIMHPLMKTPRAGTTQLGSENSWNGAFVRLGSDFIAWFY